MVLFTKNVIIFETLSLGELSLLLIGDLARFQHDFPAINELQLGLELCWINFQGLSIFMKLVHIKLAHMTFSNIKALYFLKKQ